MKIIVLCILSFISGRALSLHISSPNLNLLSRYSSQRLFPTGWKCYGRGSSSTLKFEKSDSGTVNLVGEDAATFDIQKQNPIAWSQFLIAVSGVLGSLFYVWIYNGGPQLGDAYKDIMESISGGNSTLTITFMLAFFAFCHSGLASLRPYGENIVGARVWRYIFAIVSLPLAFSSIVYFINHRYGISLLVCVPL